MRIRIASSLPTKAKGLLWGARKEDLLVLTACNDIHSLFMRKPIDLAFVGKDGAVIKVVRNFPPWRRLRVKDAVAVAERLARTDPWFYEGDQLIAMPREETP